LCCCSVVLYFCGCGRRADTDNGPRTFYRDVRFDGRRGRTSAELDRFRAGRKRELGRRRKFDDVELRSAVVRGDPRFGAVRKLDLYEMRHRPFARIYYAIRAGWREFLYCALQEYDGRPASVRSNKLQRQAI